MLKIDYCSQCALILATVVLSGCSSDRPEIVPIAGQVLVDGKPLTHGAIQFVPQGSRMSFSTLDSEGRFRLTCRDPNDGAVVGRHKVSIDGGEVLPGSTDRVTHIQWHAPKKYAEATSSGLVLDVSQPRDDVVFNLTWDGAAPFQETVRHDAEPPEHGGAKSR